jgi:Universal stress protein family
MVDRVDSKAWLEKFSRKAKTDNIGLKPELINSHEPVNYSILEYAEEKNIDLIVVGTRGRSGFKRLSLGKYCIFSGNLCSLSYNGSEVKKEEHKTNLRQLAPLLNLWV